MPETGYDASKLQQAAKQHGHLSSFLRLQAPYRMPALALFASWLILLLSPLLPVLSPVESPRNFLVFHTVMELTAMTVAIMIFAVIWNSENINANGRLTFFALAFCGAAIVGFAHAMNYEGMPDFITPNTPDKRLDFWLFGQLFSAVALLSMTIGDWQSMKQARNRRLMLLLTLFAVFAIYWQQLFHPGWLPALYIPGAGFTHFELASEYLLCLTFLAAAALIFREFTRSGEDWLAWIGAAAGVMAAGELFFTLFHHESARTYSLFGHLFKVTAYLMIYRGVFVNMVKQPYADLARLRAMHEENEDRYRTLVGNLPGSVYRCDVDYPWKVHFIAGTSKQLTGYSHSAFLDDTISISTILLKEDRKQFSAAIERAVNETGSFNVNYRIRHASGSIRWLQSRGHIHRDNGGNPLWIDGLALDISEQREAEFKFRTLVENSNDWFWEIDREYCYSYCSPRCFDVTGYAPEQLQGRPITELMVAGDMLPTMDALVDANPFMLMTTRLLHANGTIVTVEASGTPILDSDGKLSGYRGIARDISDRIATQKREALLATQISNASRMEALGNLTGGIAHDFNNILGAIYGYAKLMQHALPQENATTTTTSRYLEEILTASERARELIAQMLAFSRQQPEGSPEAAPPVELLPLITEVKKLLRATIPSTLEITLAADIGSTPLQSCIPGVKLHQSLLNLGVNARDALGEYGNIGFSLGETDLHKAYCRSCKNEFSGKFAVISVSDSGTGIPPGILDRIFEPFFTTKEVGKGSGLGLSVVHGIVHEAGGHILVESAPPKGTRISILLPLASSNQAPLSQASESPAPNQLQGQNILVVDDEKAITGMLQELLSLHGANVFAYTDSQAALDAFMANPGKFDAVITDETMPRLSGLHLSRQLLQRKPGLPVILCSGFSQMVDEASARNAGIAEFLNKPVDIHQLVSKLTRLLPAAPLNGKLF